MRHQVRKKTEQYVIVGEFLSLETDVDRIREEVRKQIIDIKELHNRLVRIESKLQDLRDYRTMYNRIESLEKTQTAFWKFTGQYDANNNLAAVILKMLNERLELVNRLEVVKT